MSCRTCVNNAQIKKDFVLNPADFEDYEYGTESTGYVYIDAYCKDQQTSTNYYTSKVEPLRIELCFNPKTGEIAYFTFMIENDDNEITQEDSIEEHISLEELISFVTYDKSVRENVATPEVVESLRKRIYK